MTHARFHIWKGPLALTQVDFVHLSVPIIAEKRSNIDQFVLSLQKVMSFFYDTQKLKTSVVPIQNKKL